MGWLSHPFGSHGGGWPPHFGQGGGQGHFWGWFDHPHMAQRGGLGAQANFFFFLDKKNPLKLKTTIFFFQYLPL
jgi:hypothetical protein